VYKYHSEDKATREEKVEDKGQDSLKTSLMKSLGDSRDKRESKTKPQQDKEKYLVCNTCRGYYQLQKSEEPEDFSDECECGGRLECRDSKG
jgi:hypothetical protein